MLFFSIAVNAAPGINKTISFQGRLLSSAGTPVPDGSYNIQFKIYEGGSGSQVGNPDGTLKWTETYTNNGSETGVTVKNGYMSVSLGAKTPFADSIDWNQDTLWLSMNIAGLSTGCSTFNTGNCTADGEMTPMKRLTATPYALNAGMVGGKSASQLIHNGTTQQTGSFNLSGTGRANTLQGNTSVITPLLDSTVDGAIKIGSSNTQSISLGTDTRDQTISIGTGEANKNVTIGSTNGSSNLTLQSGSGGVNIAGDTTFENDATINGDLRIMSADETQSAGISWNEGNTVASFNTTGNELALQGGGLSLLTAKNDNGQAKVGIGNAATSDYALDVTGDVNSSEGYAINGVSILSNSSLTFGGSSVSTVNAAENQLLQLASDTGVRVGDGQSSGEPTLFTVDRAASTPTATGDAILGSMYYDTTLGKFQCYEADGWGSCSSSPDRFVTLSPEYTNAVTNGAGIGTMTSDICSDSLAINNGSSSQPTICGTNETYNFYNWTSEELTAQTKSIFVTYQLPSNFKEFIESSTSLTGRTDSADATVSYQIYKNTSTGLVACGAEQTVATGAQTTWQKATATDTDDPTNCNFSAGESIMFKINLTASNNANAYVSTLGFAFSDD